MLRRMVSTLTIAAAFVLTQLACTFYLAAQTEMLQYFSVSREKMLTTVTICFLGYGLGQLFWGTVSDYIGRYICYVSAFISFSILALCLYFSKNIQTFMLLIALLGVSAAAFTSVGNAFFRDLFPKPAIYRVMSMVGIAMALGTVFSPIIGVYLTKQYGWQSIFMVLALFSFVLLVLFVVFIKAPISENVSNKGGRLLFNIRSLFIHEKYLRFILSLAFAFAIVVVYMSVAPFVFIHYFNFSFTSFGLIGSSVMTSYVMGSVVYAISVRRVAPEKNLKLGILVSVLGSLLFLLIVLLEQITIGRCIFAFCLMLFGAGISVPAAKAAAMTAVDHHHGLASSLMKFVQITGTVLITFIVAHYHIASDLKRLAILFFIVSVVSFTISLAMAKKPPK
jgi:MFS transporter, DHA1 family, multidrug resistance protein